MRFRFTLCQEILLVRARDNGTEATFANAYRPRPPPSGPAQLGCSRSHARGYGPEARCGGAPNHLTLCARCRTDTAGTERRMNATILALRNIRLVGDPVLSARPAEETGPLPQLRGSPPAATASSQTGLTRTGVSPPCAEVCGPRSGRQARRPARVDSPQHASATAASRECLTGITWLNPLT